MTPTGRQSNLTVEQRTEAVLSLLRREAGKAGLTGGNGQADPARREVIGEITIANRVLKKLSGQCP